MSGADGDGPGAEHLLARWRLVLGKVAEAEGVSIEPGAGADAARMEDLLGFLFSEEGEGLGQSRGRGGRAGGTKAPPLTVPAWIDGIDELFPREAKEVLEREMIRRRGIGELLDSPELLERVEPNLDLMKTILTHKDLLTEKTRGLARKLIERVVEDLRRVMQIHVEEAVTGAIRRDRHSPRRSFRNLDLKATLRQNLHRYDPGREKLLVDRISYFASERRQRPWHVIVCVDQSGSMLESAIFAAVMASIFHGLPSLRTSLVLFDTEVVDLSSQVGQPVDVLLSVQLGGGTLIERALGYCQGLVREPGRTIVVLITDFYEGAAADDLEARVRTMALSGIRMVGLGALGYDARPAMCRATAKRCRKAGMDILICTPEKLAACMARIIRG